MGVSGQGSALGGSSWGQHNGVRGRGSALGVSTTQVQSHSELNDDATTIQLVPSAAP